MRNNISVSVIGAGLAGCEAALQLANRGIKVNLYEMKPTKKSPAHKSENFAELVCSNSLKAERIASAGGLLKAEMSLFNSVCVDSAYKCRVPAGGALAVNRDDFSALVTDIIKNHPNIIVVNEEVSKIPDGYCIISSGPLTSDTLADELKNLLGLDYLSFYDAAAPIVTFESVDMESGFFASRYERGGEDDYINCPMNKEEYEHFYNGLINAESAELHSFDKKKGVYEGCMPIEIMAKRGENTIRFGPMKPVGLRDPKTGHRPWAVLQLRKENVSGSMYNLVGFQTNLKFPEQKRVFSLIPALKNAEFVRYGVMHRNTFINSPKLLNEDFSLRSNENIFFAGQITGVEGYMESAASGIMAGINCYKRIMGEEPILLPEITMIGSLAKYISNPEVEDFQPMGANFGMLPPLPELIKDKKMRYEALALRSLDYIKNCVVEDIENSTTTIE
ncbi:MAG: methylenetetrahydrofolate--tRNA-(uracil(54)-C(5))-methyltransferase (FADH(2)-oxidizing) TrmFO [Clostridia bacterium]|nr:methylenetetrahydrofolate--tRNA-(uracil(54)-C(5))-methyltransferase (FADH(2)-oxidizing) TrmFO [Clostridia bacterium]